MVHPTKQAITRVALVELASVGLAYASLRSSRILGKPSWFVAIVIPLAGFAFAVYFAIITTSSMAYRVALVAGSVLLWICCFYAVMYYFLNTYGA